MIGSLLKKTATVAAFLLPTLVAGLDKPALWPNMDFLANGLQSALYSHGASISVFIDGYIASACRERGNAEGYNLWDIQTYVVKYDDCSVEWIMCRHKNAAQSIETFVSNFGRVPVHMRQGVKAIMLGTTHPGIAAYAYGDMVVMFGNPTNVGIYLHEVTHAVAWSRHFPASTEYQDTTAWINAYNADSAVPDAYAQTNQVENLAQHTSPLIYNRYAGGVASVASGYERIANQQNAIANAADNGKYGGIFQRDNAACTIRIPNGGYEQLPPRRRATPAERRQTDDGPLAGRFWPNSLEEQREYVEGLGVIFPDTNTVQTLRSRPVEATNCTGFI